MTKEEDDHLTEAARLLKILQVTFHANEFPLLGDQGRVTVGCLISFAVMIAKNGGVMHEEDFMRISKEAWEAAEEQLKRFIN